MWWGRIGAASIAAIGGMGYYWAEINNKKEKSTEESMPPVAMKEISSGDQEHTKKRHLGIRYFFKKLIWKMCPFIHWLSFCLSLSLKPLLVDCIAVFSGDRYLF